MTKMGWLEFRVPKSLARPFWVARVFDDPGQGRLLFGLERTFWNEVPPVAWGWQTVLADGDRKTIADAIRKGRIAIRKSFEASQHVPPNPRVFEKESP